MSVFPPESEPATPCIGRQSPNPWTAREIPTIFFKGRNRRGCISLVNLVFHFAETLAKGSFHNGTSNIIVV